jgi:hypothetical protein
MHLLQLTVGMELRLEWVVVVAGQPKQPRKQETVVMADLLQAVEGADQIARAFYLVMAVLVVTVM